ncbi:Dicer-like protein [Trichinella pseudospiralis]
MNGDAVVSALFCFFAYYFLGNWIRRQIFQQYIVQDSGNEQINCHEPKISQKSIDRVESRDKDQLAIDNGISDLKNCDEKDSPPSPELPLMAMNENSKNDTNELNGQAVEEQRINIDSEFSKWCFSNNAASSAKQDQAPTSTNNKTIRDIFFSSKKNEIIVPKSALLKEKFKRSQHDMRLEKLIRQRHAYYKKNERSLFTLYDQEMMNPTYSSNHILKRREHASLIRRKNAFIQDQREIANKSSILERSRSRCMDTLTRRPCFSTKCDQRSNELRIKDISKDIEEKHRLPEAEELKKCSNDDNNASSSSEE